MFTFEKAKDRDFIILNLSDPQLGNDEWADGHKNAAILRKTVSELIARVRPDLITVSGDISWAGHREAYAKFADYMDGFGIPWAPVWGNHDNQGGPEEVDFEANEYLKHPTCVYEKGDPAIGNGNYVIKIVEDGRTVSAVFMIDSHDCAPLVHEDGSVSNDWAKLTPPQLDWYREQVKKLEAEGCRDSSMILHIPFYAYRDAWNGAFRAGIDPNTVKPEESADPKFWNPGFEGSFGVKYEGIGSYGAEDGVMALIEELGSTKYVIAGHDHVNNTVIRYHGVYLVYSLKCGAGCYWNPILNGGTVLTVGSDGTRSVRHEYVDVSELL